MIEGVVFKDLVTHGDRRGFFREIIRVSDPFFEAGFGQWSHSIVYPGATKAWHMHRRQTDWWYVASGVLRVGLVDLRETSPTYRKTMDFLMGDHQPPRVVKIPPGVAHGCQGTVGPVHLFYVTSRTYDPEDEIRIPHDRPDIAFDWRDGPPIK